MYIHEEIQLAVLPLLEKHDLELLDLIGEMCHAAHDLVPLSEAGIRRRHTSLKERALVGCGEARTASIANDAVAPHPTGLVPIAGAPE